MIDPQAPWRTSRLTAEPIVPAHAAAMHVILSDPAMYSFTGGQPPSLDDLSARYELLASRHSPDGAQIWCNWALRERATGELVGVMQATLPAEGPPSRTAAGVAAVAWEIGVAHQRQGFASEAAAAVVSQLHSDGWTVVAHVHPDHVGSQRVAERAGLAPTQRMVDGEVEWRLGA